MTLAIDIGTLGRVMRTLITGSIAATFVAALSGAATASPTTLPMTGPCRTPNASAAVSSPWTPDMPQIAAAQDISGVTKVRVDLDAQGNLVGSSVFKSSGNYWLDSAALVAARRSGYTAELRDCTPVAGSYAVDFEFQPDQ